MHWQTEAVAETFRPLLSGACINVTVILSCVQYANPYLVIFKCFQNQAPSLWRIKAQRAKQLEDLCFQKTVVGIQY